MIYELRTYTVRQGTLPDVVKAASTVSRDIRNDDYGKLEGYWYTDIGPLNQVMHLWSYADLNERARLRAELAKNPRWSGEYLPLIRPHLIRQDIRLLNGVVAPVAPARTPNVYEFRNYRTKPGAVRQWADHMMQGATGAREVFQDRRALDHRSAAGQRGVPHLGLQRSQPARPGARRRVRRIPAWQRSSRRAAPLLEEMHSTIMIPAAHSPLK